MLLANDMLSDRYPEVVKILSKVKKFMRNQNQWHYLDLAKKQ